MMSLIDGQWGRAERPSNPEDLGEDVLVLVSLAIERGKASIVRRVNGVRVRMTVEAA